MTNQDYVFQAASDTLEAERLTLLSKLYDDASHDFIRNARTLEGARVLEVGAGAGSIAMWLATEVGPSGRVLATDIDLRFLNALSHPQLEVREHDILADPIDGPFDLIHGRFVMVHLSNHAEALIEKLYAALAPGGCLVFEETDHGTAWPAERSHPRAGEYRRVQELLGNTLRAIGAADNEFGRRLPVLFRSSELTNVHSSATYDISAPGSDYHRFNELTMLAMRTSAEQLPGFTAADFDAAMEAWLDPTFHGGEMTVVRAVGYRA